MDEVAIDSSSQVLGGSTHLLRGFSKAHCFGVIFGSSFVSHCTWRRFLAFSQELGDCRRGHISNLVLLSSLDFWQWVIWRRLHYGVHKLATKAPHALGMLPTSSLSAYLKIWDSRDVEEYCRMQTQ